MSTPMPNLLILSRDKHIPCTSPHYRGTYRVAPYYRDDLDEQHPVNQAFLWYAHAGDEFGVVHDVEKARKLVELYRQIDPPEYYEVVELTDGEEEGHLSNTEFIGFDVSLGNHISLLSTGLDFMSINWENVDARFREALRPLVNLIEEYFQPRLNKFGLFKEFGVTKRFLECMMAIQLIQPNFWEGSNEFEVVGIYSADNGA